jgi:hypothetical protein
MVSYMSWLLYPGELTSVPNAQEVLQALELCRSHEEMQNVYLLLGTELYLISRLPEMI